MGTMTGMLEKKKPFNEHSAIRSHLREGVLRWG